MPKYSNSWYKKKYVERLDKAYAYLGGFCVKCGLKTKLHIHHKDPSQKSFTVTERLHGMAWEKLIEELDKCELLCVVCHKKEHEAKCGTIGRYRQGCRCNQCKEALKVYMRDYRKKKKYSLLT